MSKVEIECEGAAGYGTRIKVDGRELQGTRDILVHIGLDEANTVAVDMIALEGVDLKLEAVVSVTMVAIPGFRVIRSIDPDGSQVFRTEPDDGTTIEQLRMVLEQMERALVVRRR